MKKGVNKKIRVFMIILCLAMLVWALGKTFETDRGVWMGYKWYSIVSSDKIKKEIPYGSASLEQMKKIIDYMENDESRTKGYLTPKKVKGKSLVKINRIAAIRGFRKFLYWGKPNLYCVYKNQNGGKMFLIFDEEYEAQWFFYYENKLSVEDVNQIKEASDREEVLAIDPGVDVKMNNLIDDAYDDERYTEEYDEKYEEFEDYGEYEEYIEKTNQQSIHITDNGYIRVQYDLDGQLIEVTEQRDPMIRMIMEMEQKGITVNLYDVPYDLLPEDAEWFEHWEEID